MLTSLKNCFDIPVGQDHVKSHFYLTKKIRLNKIGGDKIKPMEFLNIPILLVLPCKDFWMKWKLASHWAIFFFMFVGRQSVSLKSKVNKQIQKFPTVNKQINKLFSKLSSRHPKIAWNRMKQFVMSSLNRKIYYLKSQSKVCLVLIRESFF